MIDISQMKGRVVNVQGYSIHDGPGVRTTVFLSGCPLKCAWCQNPESHTMESKLFFLREKCVGCGACETACPAHAVSLRDGKAVTDRDLCDGCGTCAALCFQGARELSGFEITAGELAGRVLRDRIFFEGTGGGVTLSGGEVLSQPGFASAVLSLCKGEGVHTAIETCGYGTWESFKGVLDYTDLVLYDLKHMDSSVHRTGTGVGNELILENAVRVYCEARKPMAVRVPVIPGFNDSEENIVATALFTASRLGPEVRIHLLPYHRLGESKNDRLEAESGRFRAEPPLPERMEKLRALMAGYGLEVVVGG